MHESYLPQNDGTYSSPDGSTYTWNDANPNATPVAPGGYQFPGASGASYWESRPLSTMTYAGGTLWGQESTSAGNYGAPIQSMPFTTEPSTITGWATASSQAQRCTPQSTPQSQSQSTQRAGKSDSLTPVRTPRYRNSNRGFKLNYRRTLHACKNCRKKKVRCSTKGPCTYCTTHNLECDLPRRLMQNEGEEEEEEEDENENEDDKMKLVTFGAGGTPVVPQEDNPEDEAQGINQRYT